MWFLLAVLSVVTLGSQLVAAQCVYEQSLSPGVVYQVFSPGYASNYVSGLACSWTATVPTGYKAELSCGNVAVPCPAPSPAASDSFVINQFGEKNPHWTDNRYCGSGSFSLPTIQSIGTKLNVRLTTGTNTGRFYCELKAVRTQTWNSCSCGTKLTTSRIVGGTNAGVHEFPYQAMLAQNTATNDLICGASIVNPFYALTAAHCVAGRGIMSTSLIVGEHDRSTTSDTSFTAKYAISAFIPHGGFTASTNANDIALVRTNTEMIFNIGVHAVCLPFRMQTASFVGSIVTATGWGNTEFWAGQSQILQKVNLNVISNTGSCTSTYPQAASYGFLCTYTSGKDTCQYDSGTNLYLMDSGRAYSIAVTSGGKGCASSSPTLNIRVTEYLNWILSYANGATFCNV